MSGSILLSSPVPLMAHSHSDLPSHLRLSRPRRSHSPPSQDNPLDWLRAKMMRRIEAQASALRHQEEFVQQTQTELEAQQDETNRVSDWVRAQQKSLSRSSLDDLLIDTINSSSGCGGGVDLDFDIDELLPRTQPSRPRKTRTTLPPRLRSENIQQQSPGYVIPPRMRNPAPSIPWWDQPAQLVEAAPVVEVKEESDISDELLPNPWGDSFFYSTSPQLETPKASYPFTAYESDELEFDLDLNFDLDLASLDLPSELEIIDTPPLSPSSSDSSSDTSSDYPLHVTLPQKPRRLRKQKSAGRGMLRRKPCDLDSIAEVDCEDYLAADVW